MFYIFQIRITAQKLIATQNKHIRPKNKADGTSNTRSEYPTLPPAEVQKKSALVSSHRKPNQNPFVTHEELYGILEKRDQRLEQRLDKTESSLQKLQKLFTTLVDNRQQSARES